MIESKMTDTGRADLHIHTNYSMMEGMIKPSRLIAWAEELGLSAVAVTDSGSVSEFPEVFKAAEDRGIKVIFGIDAWYQNDVDGAAHGEAKNLLRITILAQNRVGLKNLYRLVSISSLEHFEEYPLIRKSNILAHRDGLLLGSGGMHGELFLLARNGGDVSGALRFYDYVELLPCHTGANGKQAACRALVSAAKKAGKPFIIGSDAHFAAPEDEDAWKILRDAAGAEADGSCPFHLKTAEELREEFSWLDAEDLSAALFENPNAVAARCEQISPLPEKKLYPPQIEDADGKLRALVSGAAEKLYGNPVPEEVRARIDAELERILPQRAASQFLAVKALADASREAGWPVGARAGVGASMIAYLLGVTETDPLPPHYRCARGHYTEFVSCGARGCGVDLPEKACPVCGEPLIRDGFNIPYETFLGGEQPTAVDIDLNFAAVYQKRAIQGLRELFGAERVVRAGTIGTLSEYRAAELVARYADKHGMTWSEEKAAQLASGITGVMRTRGVHPGGLVVVPRDMEIEDFCPVQYYDNERDADTVITHFEYHHLEDCLVKFDLLAHDEMELLGTLAAKTGVKLTDIPMNDAETMKLFRSLSPLGVGSDDILRDAGTLGIREFSTAFMRKMLAAAQPQDFDSLMRVSALGHGTYVWEENAEKLLAESKASIKNVLGTRDDIFLDLCAHGVGREWAYTLMEYVRKGKAARKGLPDGTAELLREHGLPDWYAESLAKIGYLFPKAHAAAYTLNAYRLAWFKLHEPHAFYDAWFAYYAKIGAFDKEAALAGVEAVRERLRACECSRDTNEAIYWGDADKLEMYRLLYECLRRGFAFGQGDGGSLSEFPTGSHGGKPSGYAKERGLPVTLIEQ